MTSDVYVTTEKQQLSQTCHALEQPVTSVLTLAVAALAEPSLDPGTRRNLAEIVRQASWQADIIQDFKRPPGSAATWAAGDREPGADVVTVVNDVVAAGNLTWPCQVTVRSPAGPVWCQLRPVLLHRVLSNLLSNATRAAGQSGTVTVRIQQDEISVQDSGPGFGNMPKRYGIGLAAVARIVARHGGRLRYGRDAVGGTRVSLWLP